MNAMAIVRGVFAGLIVLFSGVWAFGITNVELADDRDFIQISDEARILSDPSGMLSLRDVLADSVQRLFSVVRQSPINKGFTKSVFWIEI